MYFVWNRNSYIHGKEKILNVCLFSKAESRFIGILYRRQGQS